MKQSRLNSILASQKKCVDSYVSTAATTSTWVSIHDSISMTWTQPNTRAVRVDLWEPFRRLASHLGPDEQPWVDGGHLTPLGDSIVLRALPAEMVAVLDHRAGPSDAPSWQPLVIGGGVSRPQRGSSWSMARRMRLSDTGWAVPRVWAK